MRIIKTCIKNRSIKLIFALTVIGIAPGLSFLTTILLPDAYEYMSEAAKYSDIILKSEINKGNEINNGSLVLYTPDIVSPVDADNTAKPVAKEEKKTAELLARNISETDEDISVFKNNSGEIYEITFDKNLGPDFINLPKGGQVRNCTELSNEFVIEESVKDFDIEPEFYSDEPQVLIMHTHTTESYEIEEKSYYDSEYICRSSDPDNSVVAVGHAIAKELSDAGISVIHDGTIHDLQYTGAYDRSLDTVNAILNEYPSIKIVLDIHRDAIEDGGDRASAVTEINGKKAAQVMIISAADDGTYDMPDYLENFHFACALQQSMESRYPTITRPVLFQYCHYNQHTTTGSLLLEVGSHGNTIEQAVYTGELIGKSIVDVFTERMVYEQPVMRTMPRFFIDRLR